MSSVNLVASDPMWAHSPWTTLMAAPHHAMLYGLISVLRRFGGIGEVLLAGSVDLFFRELFGLGFLLKTLGVENSHVTSAYSNFLNSFSGTNPGMAVAQELILERSPSWGFKISDVDASKVTINHSRGDKIVPFDAALDLRRMLGTESTLKEWNPSSMTLWEEGHMIMPLYWSELVGERN